MSDVYENLRQFLMQLLRKNTFGHSKERLLEHTENKRIQLRSTEIDTKVSNDNGHKNAGRVFDNLKIESIKVA